MNDIENKDLIKEISAIIKSGRKSSINIIKSELADCIYDIGELIEDRLSETGEQPVFEKPVAGFTPDQLSQFLDVYRNEEVYAWVDNGANGQIDDLILRLVNFRKMNKSGLKAKFPNTFQKWTEQDDQDLRTIFERKGEAGLNWQDLSEMFGRPVNAIKIRLERLGFTLSEPPTKRY